jgi:predicted enzyme related to lactoylglutathione lyase
VKIKLTSVFVDDQVRALAFYTEKIGFQKKGDVEAGGYRWLTVVSPEEPDGTELQLAPPMDPADKAFQQALKGQGRPAAMLFSDDVQRDYDRMAGLGVTFTMPPTKTPGSIIVLLDDTCGNLIQITQLTWGR